jgi:hypothetical protein
MERTLTKAQAIEALNWNIKDAREALVNMARMSAYDLVEKYVKQLKALEAQLYSYKLTSLKDTDMVTINL